MYRYGSFRIYKYPENRSQVLACSAACGVSIVPQVSPILLLKNCCQKHEQNGDNCEIL